MASSLPLIIIAHSARALAESASRAGYDVVTIDGFADTDTLAVSNESWCLPLVNGEWEFHKLTACLLHLSYQYLDANVILGSGSEQFAGWIQEETQWSVKSSHTDVLDKINAPHSFFSRLSHLKIPYPPTLFQGEPDEEGWLFKQDGKCGGMGVSRGHTHSSIKKNGYWQREINGQSVSALCISDERDVNVIGVNELYSHSDLNGYPYVYEGALANLECGNDLLVKIDTYLKSLIPYFKILGLFSIDMILHEDELFVLEINPRISASYELYEQLNPGLNLVDAHIRVCEGERLSGLQIEGLSRQHNGYLIVYAEHDCVIPREMCWPHWVKDKPESLREIATGEPICSVYFNSDTSSGSVREKLELRRNEVLSLLKQ